MPRNSVPQARCALQARSSSSLHFTAAAARNPTEFYNTVCQPGQPTFGIHVTNEGHFCIIGGGLPIVVGGDVVGGIGVSSGTAAQDIVVAQAGLDALIASL